MAFRFPILAPKIAAITDKTTSEEMIIPIEVVQNALSRKGIKKLNILHRIGTYQTLFGSFRQMIKQAPIINTA